MDYRAKDYYKLPLKVSSKWRNLEHAHSNYQKQQLCSVLSGHIYKYFAITSSLAKREDHRTIRHYHVTVMEPPQMYLISNSTSTKKPKSFNRLKILFSCCHFSGLDTYPQTFNSSQNSFYSSYKI